MSIIHEALKRQERTSSSLPNPESLASAPLIEVTNTSSAILTAIIGGGGVILAALITYLLMRPSDITVVIPPVLPESGQPQISMAAATTPGPTRLEFIPLQAVAPALSKQPDVADIAEVSPLAEYSDLSEHPPEPQQSEFKQIPVSVREEHGVQIITPIITSTNNEVIPPTTPTVEAFKPVNVPPVQSVQSVPAWENTQTPATPKVIKPINRATRKPVIPEGAMTIEIATARLEAITGPVKVNGKSAAGGDKIKIGSRISTGKSGSAALGFERADMQLVNSTRVKIIGLERRTDKSGNLAEDVKIQLTSGSLRNVVRIGRGSVSVTTDNLSIGTQNGTFMVLKNDDGSVSISAEAGLIQVNSKNRSNGSYIVQAGESIAFRDDVPIDGTKPNLNSAKKRGIKIPRRSTGSFRINVGGTVIP